MADGPDGADVTVVNVETGGGDGPPTAPADPPADVWPTVAQHGERLAGLEAALPQLAARLDEMDGRISGVQFNAEMAENTAETAIEIAIETAGNVEELAAETEEAVAEVAQEADADTPEVQAEVEEIAPKRDHPWYAKRSFMKAGD